MKGKHVPAVFVVLDDKCLRVPYAADEGFKMHLNFPVKNNSRLKEKNAGGICLRRSFPA